MNELIISIKKRYCLNTKLLFFSLMQFIFSIIFIIFFVKTVFTFNNYGWAINQINPNITLGAENIRIIFILSLTLLILITCMIVGTLYKNKKMIEKKYFYAFLIEWIFLFEFLIKIIKNKEISKVRDYSRLDDGLNKLIDHKMVFTNPNQRNNKMFFNTLFYDLTLLIFLIGFILIFVKNNNNNNPENLFLIDKLSYFTNLSNIFCFLYLFGLLFFSKYTSFKKNIWLINLSSYIVVVGLIYWCFLFPTDVVVDGDAGLLKIVRGVWLHTITPIFFVAFSILSFKNIKNEYPKLKDNILIGIIYPLWYGSYIYTLPFLVRVSIYGFITNPNPYLILFGDNKPTGNAWSILSIFGFGIIFIIFFTIFNKINKKLFIK